ncbi:hypothetical protein ACKC9G_14900 [Pokkaliibacter sp. CJK22405]|uniref:hypothetical protein n=1 Tax=Pokkaliibacter sp. CJK22405 TaxID=3384615 RepID=UPI003984BB27
MSHADFEKLLSQWEAQAQDQQPSTEISVTLSEEDHERLQALAILYGMTADEVSSQLMHTALKAVESSMPYLPGTKVIREEEGEAIYEDIGPTPRYLKLREELRQRTSK